MKNFLKLKEEDLGPKETWIISEFEGGPQYTEVPIPFFRELKPLSNFPEDNKTIMRRVMRQEEENSSSLEDSSSSSTEGTSTVVLEAVADQYSQNTTSDDEKVTHKPKDPYAPVWHTYTFEVSPIVGLSFGLGVMIATQIFAHISLGHFNPAISIAAWVLCKSPTNILDLPLNFTTF